MCGKCGVIGVVVVVPAIAMKSEREKERGRMEGGREEEEKRGPTKYLPPVPETKKGEQKGNERHD